MISTVDEQLLRRAVRIAMSARGRVEPNPMVGCVLARDGRVIAEGHHARFGGPHAEAAALADCHIHGHDARGATAYVTLEPCCHTNKKTPPCVPRLIDARIARVIIGCLDPNPDVDGNGVSQLRAAGVEVVLAESELAAECRQLIAPFCLQSRGRGPYVTLKWAQSVDGRVAGPNGRRTAISGAPANHAVHRLRARSDAIAVGINTAINDDPHLMPRGVATERVPTRVVLDTTLRLPRKSQLVRTINEGPIVLYASRVRTDDAAVRQRDLRAAGVDIVELDHDDASGHLSLNALRIDWAARGWTDLLVEPGPTLAASLLATADRVWRIESPMRISDSTAPAAAELPAHYVESGRVRFGVDVLVEFLNREADSFVTATPSADLVFETEANA